jgi:hypothetical protein
MTQTLNKWKLDSVFEKKDEQGNYTNDALLCQDILLYVGVISRTVLENNPFELRELQKWIVENNKQMKNITKIPRLIPVLRTRYMPKRVESTTSLKAYSSCD